MSSVPARVVEVLGKKRSLKIWDEEAESTADFLNLVCVWHLKGYWSPSFLSRIVIL